MPLTNSKIRYKRRRDLNSYLKYSEQKINFNIPLPLKSGDIVFNTAAVTVGASTTMYTVPLGKILYITHAQINVTSTSDITTGVLTIQINDGTSSFPFGRITTQRNDAQSLRKMVDFSNFTVNLFGFPGYSIILDSSNVIGAGTFFGVLYDIGILQN